MKKHITLGLVLFSIILTGCQKKNEEEQMKEIGEKIKESSWDKPTKDTTTKSIYIKYETMDDISVEIRVYKPHDKKYTAGSITYKRKMEKKENMIRVNYYYDKLFERDNRVQGASSLIDSDESCYFNPDDPNDTDCSVEEVEEIKTLINQSEEVLDDVGISEEELIKYVYWKYVPEEEKMDDE